MARSVKTAAPKPVDPELPASVPPVAPPMEAAPEAAPEAVEPPAAADAGNAALLARSTP